LIKKPSRTTVFLATCTALSLLGDQALYALLPLYFQDIGLLPIQVGILLSANRLIRLFTNHLAERMTGQYPPHLMLAGSLAVGALLTAVYATSSSFFILLTARCLWGPVLVLYPPHQRYGCCPDQRSIGSGPNDGTLQWDFPSWWRHGNSPGRDIV